MAGWGSAVWGVDLWGDAAATPSGSSGATGGDTLDGATGLPPSGVSSLMPQQDAGAVDAEQDGDLFWSPDDTEILGGT